MYEAFKWASVGWLYHSLVDVTSFRDRFEVGNRLQEHQTEYGDTLDEFPSPNSCDIGV